MKTFTDTIIKTKTTGNFELRAIRREFDNGRVTFGMQILKNGKQNYRVGFGYSERQILRNLRRHNASEQGPNTLLCG